MKNYTVCKENEIFIQASRWSMHFQVPKMFHVGNLYAGPKFPKKMEIIWNYQIKIALQISWKYWQIAAKPYPEKMIQKWIRLVMTNRFWVGE